MGRQLYTLHAIACLYGASVEVVKLLLDVGGEDLIAMKDDDGQTALDRYSKLLIPVVNDLNVY